MCVSRTLHTLSGQCLLGTAVALYVSTHSVVGEAVAALSRKLVDDLRAQFVKESELLLSLTSRYCCCNLMSSQMSRLV